MHKTAHSPLHLESILGALSLIKILNNKGLAILPCGTPHFTKPGSVITFSKFTYCFLFDKYDFN